MEGNNLIIKGKTYTVDNLTSLPEEINGYNSTSKHDRSSIGFFGELNPMSNFHRCHFEVNGKTYHSTEQYIQSEKASYFKDDHTANKIMEASTPIECKQLAREIDNFDFDRWKQVAKETCYPGIRAKFLQNHNLSNILKSTGSQTLVESSYDTLWGTGIPLHREDCLNNSAWTSIGLLGMILMDIRNELQTT